MARDSDHTKKKNMSGKLGKLGASLRPSVQTVKKKIVKIVKSRSKQKFK
jgi:hypothetical protein